MTDESDYRHILVDTAHALFGEACTPEAVRGAFGTWLPELWGTLAELGFGSIGVPEDLGGSGGTLADALTLVEISARYAAAVPLAESVLAGQVAVAAGLRTPAGAVTVAQTDASSSAPIVASRVPWAAEVEYVLVVDQSGEVIVARLADCEVKSVHPNLAGEPRADVTVVAGSVVDRGSLADPWSVDDVDRLGAMLRVVQIVGALGRIRDLTLEYVAQREQFGRPLTAFQAVQQQIAELVGVVTAAQLAADACTSASAGDAREIAISAAKAYVGLVCGQAAGIAHQLHGAIGITEEHELHLFTRRVWAWREEFGPPEVWADRLGRYVFAVGAGSMWASISR